MLAGLDLAGLVADVGPLLVTGKLRVRADVLA